MTDKQQTAVQWLAGRIPEWQKMALPGTKLNYTALFDRAIEMEREQIVNAHLTGLIYPLEMSAGKQAEQYFTDTYQQL